MIHPNYITAPMGRARSDIVSPHSLIHVTWRCHDKKFYLKSHEMKQFVYKTLLKYKSKYGIKIIDYVIMDNHIHFTAFVEDLKPFSSFMRSSNSIIARRINDVYDKRSQAIEDRYRSPVIMDEEYHINTIGYIWQNPVRANIIDIADIEEYLYSSLYCRYRGIKDELIEDYESIRELLGHSLGAGESCMKFVRDFVNRLKSEMSDLSDLCSEIFEHIHSIGTNDFRLARRRIDQFRSSLGP